MLPKIFMIGLTEFVNTCEHWSSPKYHEHHNKMYHYQIMAFRILTSQFRSPQHLKCFSTTFLVFIRVFKK